MDLFLECATRVISGPGGGRFRFAWIGNGFDPKEDTRVSAYLADQIKRAGIQNQVSIVRATTEIEHAYNSLTCSCSARDLIRSRMWRSTPSSGERPCCASSARPGSQIFCSNPGWAKLACPIS